MRTLVTTFMSCLIVSSILASEQKQFFRLNNVLLFNHVLPRYEKFSKKTNILVNAAKIFCLAPSKSNLIKIKKAFHSAADSWASIEHIQFGPIEEKLRMHRIYFWPDKHNIGSRHLRRLLKNKNYSKLKQERFSLVSVALQGFPALERLLFSQSEKLFRNEENSRFRCAFVQAISKNLNQISQSILDEWMNQIKDFNKAMDSSEIIIYKGEKEIFHDYLASFYRSLRSIHELKLRRILGESTEDSRPRLAEFWRSERSLRNIILNLEALQQLFKGDGEFGIGELIERNNPKSSTAKDFKIYLEYAIKTARTISPPLHKSILDPDQFEQVDRLQAQVLSLIGFVRTRITSELGMAGPGFNSLDGD